MTFKKYDKRVLKRCQQKTRNIGKRSIYDIIKDNELDFGDKVDYIRHHYTYYEGNYDFFHDKKGASNERKEQLNQLIKLIILRQVDPSELKNLNKQILKWRKEKNGEKIIRKQAIIPTKLNYMDIATWKEKALKTGYDFTTLSLIEEYLLSRDNIYTSDQLKNLNYRQIKKVAKNWKENKKQPKNKHEIKKQKQTQWLSEFKANSLPGNDNNEQLQQQSI